MKNKLLILFIAVMYTLSLAFGLVGCARRTGTGTDNGKAPPAAEHTHIYDQNSTDQKYIKSAGSCKDVAVYYYSCKCGEKGTTTFNGSLDPQNHVGGTEKRNAVAATCAAEGYSGDTYCKGCNAKLSDGQATPINSSNHVGGTEKRNAVAATCVAEGYSGDTYCKGCDAKLSDGHNTSDPANHCNVENTKQQDPTCVDVGYTAGEYCNDCGTYISGHDEIRADGHKLHYTSIGNDKHKQLCSECGYIEADEIPCSGGTATCESKAVCAYCLTEYGELSEHVYENGVCVCGDLQTKGLAYNLLGEGDDAYYEVSIGDCTDTEIYIPNEYNGKPVKEIAWQGFAGERRKIAGNWSTDDPTDTEERIARCRNITKVALPLGIVRLKNAAFAQCVSLESINFPSTVRSLDYKSTFAGCTSLKSIDLSATEVDELPTSVCNGCTSLTEVKLSAFTTSIGDSAFANCTSLESIRIPESVVEIWCYVFVGCTNLGYVYFENSSGWKRSFEYNSSSWTSVNFSSPRTSINRIVEYSTDHYRFKRG